MKEAPHRFDMQRRRKIWAAVVALLGASWFGAAPARVIAQSQTQTAAQTQGHIKVIDNPGGGRIYLGSVAGQPTPQQALGKALHWLSTYSGNRPQLGHLVKSSSGEILAAFFTVTAARQDGKPMAGLALALTPNSGSAVVAILMDEANRFPTTVNPMFARLKQELPTAPTQSSRSATPPGGSTAPAVPPQPLLRNVFPDGTGVIGLPAGWQVKHAKLGDVFAVGPHSEKLRFGLALPIVGNGGRAGASFYSIPYGTDPASAYKSAIMQLYHKNGKQPPEIDVKQVQEIPLQGGKNYFLFGNMDAHDGLGRQIFIVQMINTPPKMMGTWQMTLYQVDGPEQAIAAERSTIAAIYPSYNADSRRITGIVNAQILQGIEQTQQFGRSVNAYTDSSDRATAGVSDLLREQSVVLDTQDGSHGRTSDDLANLLVNSNPNRYQVVPTSGYQRGIDY